MVSPEYVVVVQLADDPNILHDSFEKAAQRARERCLGFHRLGPNSHVRDTTRFVIAEVIAEAQAPDEPVVQIVDFRTRTAVSVKSPEELAALKEDWNELIACLPVMPKATTRDERRTGDFMKPPKRSLLNVLLYWGICFVVGALVANAGAKVGAWLTVLFL